MLGYIHIFQRPKATKQYIKGEAILRSFVYQKQKLLLFLVECRELTCLQKSKQPKVPKMQDKIYQRKKGFKEIKNFC